MVELGRQARVASKLRTRQPLRRLVVEGADRVARYTGMIADELRVKGVELGPIEATELRVRPNLKVLGPRLGAELALVRKALDAGEWEQLPDGGFRVAGHDLSADDVLVERTEKEGWAVASTLGLSVALDTTLDDELLLEGRVYDLIHAVNVLRKERGFAITDRIALRIPRRRRRPAGPRRLDQGRDARHDDRSRRRRRDRDLPRVTPGAGPPPTRGSPGLGRRCRSRACREMRIRDARQHYTPALPRSPRSVLARSPRPVCLPDPLRRRRPPRRRHR